MNDLSGPFRPPAPPTTPLVSGEAVGRVVRFAFTRTIRLVTPLMCGLWGSLLSPGDPLLGLAVGAAVGLALWLPPTVALGRVVLQPRPPDHHLTDDAGRPANEADLRLGLRAASAENLVATLPLLAVTLWLARSLHVPIALSVAAGCALAVWLAIRTTHWVAVWRVREGTLDLAVGDDPAAVRHLAAPARVGGRVGDHARYLLALARFRLGEVDAAVAQLDAIRDRTAWQVDTLRAQMRVAADPAHARLRAAEVAVSDDGRVAAKVLLALADLHEGQAGEVVARAGTLLAGEPDDARRLLGLLLAAALATTDRDAAAALRAEHGWSDDRVRRLAVGWPALSVLLR